MVDSKFDNAYMKVIKNPCIYEGSLEESVAVILSECSMALSVSRVSLWLLSEDQRELTCFSQYISDEKELQSGAVISREACPSYFDALLNSRFIDANDVMTDLRTIELKSSYLEPMNVKSLLDATIRQLQHDGLIQGVLCAEMLNEKRIWTSEEKMFAASMADLLSQRLISSRLDQSEAKYQALYEGASDGLLVFGRREFIDVNPAACEMFRGTKEQLMNSFPIDISPKYQNDGELSMTKARRYVAACLDGRPQVFEWVHTRFDGTKFNAETTLNAVKLSGKFLMFALVRDITARKEKELLENENYQLETARKEAEESAKSKMNFLANMSHEIRTPMNGIFGMVSLVLNTSLSDEQKDYIETIQSSTESLLTILNDVLEYSKLSNAKPELECREFNIRHLVNDVVRTFHASATSKQLILDSLVYPDIPSVLLGDDHRLRQILTNLVGNAIKFTNKGSVNIKVSSNNNLDNGSRKPIRFSITDTGIGMDEITIEKLFQPFTQADASITRNYGGTGLGLAICNDLAQAMEGKIEVHSKIEEGTTFHFDVCLDLPNNKKRKLSSDMPYQSQPTIQELAQNDDFSNISVLVVEDNLINQKVTSSVIEKLGYHVTIANNGQEAVKLCENNDYSIIFMDLSMPEMDGFEATEIIRSNEKEGERVTIVAVTGHAFLEYRQRCEEVGIDDFLSKPYNLFKLKEKLDFYSKDIDGHNKIRGFQ